MAMNGVDDLSPLALAVVSLAIVVAIGAVVLANMRPVSFAEREVNNEGHQPTAPFPSNITVDKASDADFQGVKEDSEKLVLFDKSASTNTTLTAGTDYVSFYDSGTFELQNTTATKDYNESEDRIFVDYTWKESAEATGVLDTGLSALKTFAEFFTVIVIVGIAAVLFLLLRVPRKMGGTA